MKNLDIENIMKKPCHVHFVGIGGISMSGLAEILIDNGYNVSGSDSKESAVTDRLTSLGATIHYGHSEKYSGLAFGIGIERTAMLKYGINNIKLLFESDLRVLKQLDD